jgi:4-carboxymuconolactone decarboxylase
MQASKRIETITSGRWAALASAASLLTAGAAEAQPQPQTSGRPSGPVQQKIAPGLAGYTDEVLFGAVWPSPELSQRDRSLVVISTLIATNKPAQLRAHLGRALDNGVTPTEASGVLTHMALYAGWPNAVTALEVYEAVYTARNIDFAALQAPLSPSPEAPPTDRLTGRTAAAAPKFARLTDEIILGDLWRRTDLTVRDRSLVTIAALAAMGDADQLPAYLRRGVAAGLTPAQIAEALTHLAFYAGWPKATKAIEAVAATLPPAAAAQAAPAQNLSGNFNGSVVVTEPFRGVGDATLAGATVSFEPAARTRWHAHPFGQLLVVTAGEGWMQRLGQPARRLQAGDVVWTPPGERHWHGATRASGLTHVAVAEEQPGRAVQWFGHVSDTELRGLD